MLRALCLLALLATRAAGGELGAKLAALASFDAREPSSHVMNVSVGVYFDHLYSVDDKQHTFDSDFFLTYQWQDDRDYSSLFADPGLTEIEPFSTCKSQSHRHLAKGQGRKFLELGHDELKYIWLPDLHLRNQFETNYKLISEMARIYESGLIELILFVRATLQMQSYHYELYPFDSQELSIVIESMSHTTSRIVLFTLPELTGLEESFVHDWPGWNFVSLSEDTKDVVPEYGHANPCRMERRSQAVLHLHVRRVSSLQFTNVILPTILLVITSWAAFFVSIKALMPRVATGFISFLTLNNWSAAQNSQMPTVNYPIWFKVFMDIARYSVFLAMIETAAAQFIFDTISHRTGRALDRFARIVMPLDFALLMVGMIAAASSKDAVAAMSYVSMANMIAVIVAASAYLFVIHRRMRKSLRDRPLEVYDDGLIPLDMHEVRVIFEEIADGPMGGAVTISRVISWLVEHESFKHALTRSIVHSHHVELLKQKEALVSRLEKKLGRHALTIEGFVSHQQLIFEELRAWIFEAVGDTREGNAVDESEVNHVRRHTEDEEESESKGDGFHL